jgi:GMP synthase-like glutamine amidotransferase
MRIHCFQHVSFENPGSIKEWAEGNGHVMDYTLFFQGDHVFPEMDDFDILLVMGGFMNVDEEEQFPWLKTEKAFILQAIKKGKKCIGICLGSQLISNALSERVYPNAEKEIGFFPVVFTERALSHPFFNHFTNPYTVFHWHGDTFDLPDSAVLIASTEECRNQAYIIGNSILCFQFHIEMDQQLIEELLFQDAHELEEEGRFIQKADMIRMNFQVLEQNRKDLFLLLDKFMDPE